jgi:hypothetical protein
MPMAEIQGRCPEYRDLEEEAYALGLHAVMGQFAPLFMGRRCPRCGAEGGLGLNQLTYLGRQPRY